MKVQHGSSARRAARKLWWWDSLTLAQEPASKMSRKLPSSRRNHANRTQGSESCRSEAAEDDQSNGACNHRLCDVWRLVHGRRAALEEEQTRIAGCLPVRRHSGYLGLSDRYAGRGM